MPKRSEEYIREKKLQILRSAQRIALRKGLARTSLRDISRNVGMSMGSIANYFPKRQEIVAFAAEQARSARARDLDTISRAPDPRKAFLEWMTGLVGDRSFANSALLELELVIESVRSEEVKSILSENAQAMVEMLTLIFQDKDTDAEAAHQRAKLILALYYGLAALRLLDITPRKKETAQAFETLIQSGDQS